MNKILLLALLALSPLLTSAAHAALCDPLFNVQVRRTSDLVLNYYDDEAYLKMFDLRRASGIMTSRFDSKLDTRIYHGSTGLPDLNTGELPVVDPRAKGLFVFLHGSGTMNATGKNFSALLNQIDEYGLAGLSFDLPFHADGPTKQRFSDPNFFMRWVKKIIDKYKVPGMPVYLIGHSFGADLIPEFMYRYPNAVDGGLSISLVGYTPELKNWYLTKTRKMSFDGVAHNTVGDEWGDGVTEKFIWSKQKFNARNLRVLVGDHEEYVPGPTGGRNGKPIGPNTYDYKSALLGIIPNATVTVEKGVGHYIFDHTDENGRNAILRDMLLVAGLDPSLLDSPQRANVNYIFSNTEAAIQKFASDPFFRSWVRAHYGSNRAFFQMIRKYDEKVSKGVLRAYENEKKEREAHLNL